ncbi:MAG: hypothetical protein J6K29_04635 [Clostridia bacterium]|nr:hypothetical protein [Clostridia bacterium]
MTTQEFIARREAEVTAPMLDYYRSWSEDGEGGYNETHIQKCADLLDGFAAELAALDAPVGAKRDKKIMAAVKKLVLALNKLNEKTDYEMLETDERDNICVLIRDAAVQAGLTEIPEDDDVTGEWREF